MIRVESPWERRTGYLSIYTPEGSHLGSTIRGKKLSTDPLCEDSLKDLMRLVQITRLKYRN